MKYDERQVARAKLILDNDFERFIDPSEDPVYGRTVPPELLKELFGRETGWLAFKSRTQKKWLKFLKKQKMPDRVKNLLSRNILEALGEI